MNKYKPLFWVRFVNNAGKHPHVSTTVSIVHPLPSQIAFRINVLYCAVDGGIYKWQRAGPVPASRGHKPARLLRHNVSFLSVRLLSFQSENTSGGLLNNESNLVILPSFRALAVSDYRIHIF